MVYIANWMIINHLAPTTREPGFTPLIRWVSTLAIRIVGGRFIVRPRGRGTDRGAGDRNALTIIPRRGFFFNVKCQMGPCMVNLYTYIWIYK